MQADPFILPESPHSCQKVPVMSTSHSLKNASHIYTLQPQSVTPPGTCRAAVTNRTTTTAGYFSCPVTSASFLLGVILKCRADYKHVHIVKERQVAATGVAM